MTVHLVHQEIRMMILVVGATVIKTVGGVWTDLTANKKHSQSQLRQNKMTGEQLLHYFPYFVQVLGIFDIALKLFFI